MGILLRGAQQRFNPQIHTEKNSLTTKMQKHFAVRRKSFDLFNRYNKFQSWMYYSGRVGAGARAGKMKAHKEISDNAYRVSYEGMNILPAYSFGKAQIGTIFAAGTPNPDMSGLTGIVTYTGGLTAGTVATNTFGSIAIKHDPGNNIFGDKFNPNDSVALGNGLGINIIFLDGGRLASTNDHYVYNFKTVGAQALFDESHLAADVVLTEGGNFFGEGSMKGYQRTNKNKWRINYSFISRYTLTMTGSAKSQKIAEIYNSESRGQKMWEFAEVLRGEEIFRMMQEQALRHARTTMNPSSHAWFENFGTNQLTVDGFNAESGIDSPMIGDGWIPQIQDNATFDYNPNNALSHTLIEAITNVLATRSPKGNDGNTFLAVGDRIGRVAFDRGMKLLMQFDTNSATSGASNIVYNVATGQEMKLGFEVTSYYYLGNWFIFIEDELFNNPGLYPTNGGLVGTGNIYLLNTSVIQGVPNFEVFAKQGRSLRKKFVNGMHSFDSNMDNSNLASSGFDGCSIHMLSELMPVLYDVRSCGVLRASAAYTGGALTGHALAGQAATEFIF